jgi:hypothetical protein
MPSYDTTYRNTRMDALTTALGLLPVLKLYSSSAGSIPASVMTTPSSLNVLLAQVAITSSNFAPAASSGLLTANAFTTESAADGTGTATYARLCTSTGLAYAQFTCGSSVGNEIVMNTASVSSGAAVAVTSLTILEGNA